jgi:hypothetical protein
MCPLFVSLGTSGNSISPAPYARIEETVIQQAESLILDVSDDDAETILSRCRLAYRRELARCLAEHLAKMAGE